jgi:hypothetical protein
MNAPRTIAALFAMLFAAGAAAAQDDWASYRDTYRAMVAFDKYGGPKNLLLQQLQAVSPAPLQSLRVEGGSTHLQLPLDATGRTVFPLVKSAWDDNAAVQAHGRFVLRARVSIAVRADGVYALEALRAACAQALAFDRARGGGATRCAGVRFVFATGGEQAPLHLRGPAGETALALAPGPAFDDAAATGLRRAELRLDGAAQGQLLASSAPLAIVPLLE